MVTVSPARDLLHYFAMSLALALLVLSFGAVAAIAYHLRRAPAGFEDDSGFHFSSPVGNHMPRESGLGLGIGADEDQSSASRRRTLPIGVPQVREAH